MQPFTYFQRQVYGVYKIYPRNEIAHQFAQLLGVKTFSAQQLRQIAGLGYALQELSDPRGSALLTQIEDWKHDTLNSFRTVQS